MYSNVRQMMWVAVSLSLFITAWALAVRSLQISGEAAESALLVHSNIAKNVSLSYSAAATSPAEYSGAQIIYMWRNSGKEGTRIEIDGTVLPLPRAESDPDFAAPVLQISPAAKFLAAYHYDKSGRIDAIKFQAQ